MADLMGLTPNVRAAAWGLQIDDIVAAISAGIRTLSVNTKLLGIL